MKKPFVHQTLNMTLALAELVRATAALEKNGGGANPRQLQSTLTEARPTVARREEDSGLRRAANDPSANPTRGRGSGGGCGRKKRAE